MTTELFGKTTRSRLARAAGAAALLTVAMGAAGTAGAAPGDRILATGGASSVEGAAGGGIVPWAILSGYGERDQVGGTAWITHVSPPDFAMNAFGAAVSFSNRVELSIGRQEFDIDSVVAGERLEQDILGVKTRLAGDLIYTRLPQISLGAQFKRNDSPDLVPTAIGAEDDSGVDVYLAATKLWLSGPFGRSAFLNTTLRATRANQLGLMGFGGDRKSGYSVVGEVSAGLFLTRRWAIGAEYRQKPDNLGFAGEDDWYDAFVGWFPNKRVAVVAAWSDLGSIANFDDQRSLYLSLQLSH